MMDENILQKVLERAFSDQQFRSRLEASLDETLEREGYNLSSDERRQLKGILDESQDAFATGLDQRLSQSGVSLSPQALLRAKSKGVDKQEGLLIRTDAGEGYKRQVRGGRAPERRVSGKLNSEGESLEPVDDREPDYEVETD